MTPAKQRQKMESLNVAAIKVYDAVPVQESWSIDEIVRAMHRSKSNLAYNVVQGCLKVLRETGLARETTPGFFQRTEIRDRRLTSIAPAPIPEPEQQEDTVSTKTISLPAPRFVVPETTALDLLMEAVANTRKAANEMEAAIALVKEELTKKDADLAQFAQLRMALKGLV